MLHARFAFGVSLFTLLAVSLSSACAERAAAEPPAFDHAKEFFKQYCVRCHNAGEASSGVRVDQLDAAFEDRHLRLWTAIRKQLADEVMPPDDERQPTAAERQTMVAWIDAALDAARSRPRPKNGLVRRLTVAQYRNTLRELLGLEDELADALPPDAVSRDGFVNNQETLQLSPLSLEAYFQIAEEALNRSIVDASAKPTIQNFRVDLGTRINPDPYPDKLILGALSLLLENEDFVVTQLTPRKPFPFEPLEMRTKFRFLEGYIGNGTIREWRDFDSIYHAVFACMRSRVGYPMGDAHAMRPEGLLLRPSVPTDNTYGPSPNFKIALRELPDHGRFRVTVTAAKYDDGLLLDRGTKPQPPVPQAVVCRDPQTPQRVTIVEPGIYQIDVHASPHEIPRANASRLAEGLIGAWHLDGNAASDPERPELAGQPQEGVKFTSSPFGTSASLSGQSIVVKRHDALNVGQGDFTAALWVHPRQIRQTGFISRGRLEPTQGWYLDSPDNQGILRFETFGPEAVPNGSIEAPSATIAKDTWQHLAAVVRRAPGESRLYVNGHVVAKGSIGTANLDHPRNDLHLGRLPGSLALIGELDEVRLYRRALDEAEILALVEPGRKLIKAQEKPPELALELGYRQFVAKMPQPAFLALRLPAGPLDVKADYSGLTQLERIAFTRLADDHKVARQFATFEQRSPQLRVHVGLRRDCGSTLAPVGPPQSVSSGEMSKRVFTGAIKNFPSPDVEKDNVNYLAGIQEIGVRSEFTDGRDMPRLVIRAVEFEGPLYEAWPPEPHRNIFIAFDRKDDQPAYAREIIHRFASRAFRRPVAPAEEAALMDVFTTSMGEGAGFQESIKHALRVVLTSPQFLFLIERSSSPAVEPLDDHELASKLSYFLWNAPPDHRLMELAASGKLHQELDAEVDRLVADRRFSQFTDEFATQWLSLSKFDVLEADLKQFPKLSRHVRDQLRREPVQFVEYLFRNNLPVSNLIESDFLVANETVAEYYGLANKCESGFSFTPLKHGRPGLGGVMTQPAIMAGLSDGRESNPVKRGAWIARRIVAEPPDDPPPNVPALEKSSEHLTLRQRLEQHRNQVGCAQCHKKIDPWGLPFEELDAGGRFKSQAVDARSSLPDGTEVAGVADLKRYLADDRIDQIAFSVLKHLAIYACGRSLTYNELEFLKQDGLQLKPAGYRMQDMIRFVVHSPLFLEK